MELQNEQLIEMKLVDARCVFLETKLITKMKIHTQTKDIYKY